MLRRPGSAAVGTADTQRVGPTKEAQHFATEATHLVGLRSSAQTTRYRLSPDGIDVVRVVHGARRLDSLML